jgi:hypothetical protein
MMGEKYSRPFRMFGCQCRYHIFGVVPSAIAEVLGFANVEAVGSANVGCIRGAIVEA